MTGISTVEIAKRQRHLHLLQKVKENKTLSRAEMVELKKYERQTADKIIAKTRIISTRPSTKHIKKKTKKRKARLPVDEAEVRKLGLECENFTEADATIRTRKSLAKIFKKYTQLRQAWDRGRFLRNLRGLARTGASVPEASKKLGFVNARVLREMIDEDVEVGDLWDQTQLGIYIEIKSALVEAAKEGKADAVRAVETFLLDEKERPGFDPSHITILQLAELTGKARQTIHEWHTKFNLPRNADKTFDLSIFLAWYEEFLIKKATAGKELAAVLDPLKTMKAEKLKIDLARHKNELLDRSEVIIGQVAWVQNIVSFCERGIEELSRLCSSQPREKIVEIARGFFRDLHIEAAKVPKELHLPAAKERELIEFLQRLKPHDDR
ncbi:MAG: hypothetical protein ACETVZ_00215 [Phycisphaerae bacterium]